MTDDELRAAYAVAFLQQARSDWRVFGILAASEVPRCHSLHCLQMACEKVGKAYRLRGTASPVEVLLSKHVGFPQFVRSFLMSPRVKQRYVGRDAQFEAFERKATALARAIETLAPSVDKGAQPENSEYPWETGTGVTAPCEYPFPNLSLLREPDGRAFLKLIEEALRDLDGVRLP